jgi:hypothetical protein
VIKIFRQNNAIDKKTAKTMEELGLQPRSFAERMLHTRDFKPYALDALFKAEIIKNTEEGRLYLDEDKLIASGLEGKVSPYR